MNGYATVNLDDGSTNDDPPTLILVVVVGTALVHVSPASVFLGLAWRQPAIAPTGLFSVAPSRGALVAISVHTILVAVAAVPAPVVVPIMLVSVLVFILLPVISHQPWRAHASRGKQSEYCQHGFAPVFSIVPASISVLA